MLHDGHPRADAATVSRTASAAPANVLSVDVEDWHQLATRRLDGRSCAVSHAVVEDTARVLDLLAAHDTLATFFVVGSVAEAHPGLVRRIADAGHEVASHGAEHRRVDQLGPAAFRADLHRSIQAIEESAQRAVAGFRAPEFSLRTSMAWAFETLADAGLRYDSSIVPVRSRRYGEPRATPVPNTIRTDAGPVVELPLATARVAGRALPAGGGCLRVLSARSLAAGIAERNARGHPAVCFLHPYDMSADALRLSEPPADLRSRVRAAVWGARRNIRRGAPVARRVEELLATFAFGRAIDLVDAIA